MPKIPLYEQQTRVSAETSSPLLYRSAEIQSIQNIANTYAKGVGNLASGINDMIDNYEKLEEQSAVADANQELIDFKLGVANERLDVLKRDDIDLTNYNEQYLIPKQKEFKEKLAKKGYSPKALQKIMPILEGDLADMVNEEALNGIKVRTEEHVTNLKKEGISLVQTTKHRLEGIKRFDEAVADGFMTREEADTAITTGDKLFFEANSGSIKIATINIGEGGLEKAISDIDPERWKSMDDELKDEILATQRDKLQKEYVEGVDTVSGEYRKKAEAGLLTQDEINDANVTKELKDSLIRMNKNAIAEIKKGYSAKEAEGKVSISLENLDKDIGILFTGKGGKFTGLGKTPQEKLNDILERIDDPSVPTAIQNDYHEQIEEYIGTPQGYKVFVEGQEGVSVYGGQMETEAWEQFWRTYDEASTYMPAYEKGEFLTRAKTEFFQFIKQNRGLATGSDLSEVKAKRLKGIFEKEEKEKAERRIGEVSGGLVLEFDKNGIMITNDRNKAILNKFFRSVFTKYDDFKAINYYNKAINKSIEAGRGNVTYDRFLVDGELTEISVENELINRGILQEITSPPLIGDYQGPLKGDNIGLKFDGTSFLPTTDSES